MSRNRTGDRNTDLPLWTESSTMVVGPNLGILVGESFRWGTVYVLVGLSERANTRYEKGRRTKTKSEDPLL